MEYEKRSPGEAEARFLEEPVENCTPNRLNRLAQQTCPNPFTDRFAPHRANLRAASFCDEVALVPTIGGRWSFSENHS
jgi:hypothetical protein